MEILKFGGTSVGEPARMHHVAKLITKTAEPRMVVLSAVSGTTNSLVAIGEALFENKKKEASQIILSLKDKYFDFVANLLAGEEFRKIARGIVSEHFQFMESLENVEMTVPLNKELLAQGELLSTKLFYTFLQESAIDAALIPALDFMVVDEQEEPVIEEISLRLKGIFEQYPNKSLFITQGFICRSHTGQIDNLKRGGSDYSASIIGAAINASEIQIWTDIDGMHNNDPRIVPNTHPIAALSFDEAAELAYFGAKILHPSSIRPAQRYNIPVRLLNTMNPSAKGTLIDSNENQEGIKAIAAKDGITAIRIKSSRMLLAYGFLRKVFEIFEKYKTPIDMITTSEVAVSLTVDDKTNLQSICNELEKFGSVVIDENMSIVCIVGGMVVDKKGIMNKIFDALINIPIRMISYGGSKNNVSILIETKNKEEALLSLNKGIFNPKDDVLV